MNIADLETFSRVRITTKEEVFEGLILPKEGDTIILKLDSGYNVGIFADSITDIEVVAAPQVSGKKEAANLEQDKDLPVVQLFHTGGTIASKIDYETGAVVGKFTPEELLALYPELQQVAQVNATMLENMQSDDFRFSHFNTVARAIHEQVKKGTSRCIVTCGTDFLHYMSAALSFLLKDVPVGVLVVGSQRSSDRGSSDAFMNLMCATQFLAQSNFQGVGICTHSDTSDSACDIIRGVNARKMHSSARATFKAINDFPVARVDYPELTMELYQTLPLCEGKVPDQIPQYKEDLKIGMMQARPQMFAKEFEVYDGYDGLVLVGSGLGHFPISLAGEHEEIAKELKVLCSKMPVIMTTQTLHGRVNMNIYSPQRKLRAMGILGHQCSMIPETAYMKLAFLLSTDASIDLYEKDMIGEQPKTDMGDFL